ncbi:MAG: divalent-cation tolerance protein CutA [Magnetovibrio sp.]|nr:divalent-cation tolerance protein CutA [Magnetovibrio sp.]
MNKPKHKIQHPLQWLYVTASSRDEANQIAKTLVTERLVACANILGEVQSVYWWDGHVQDDQEVALVLKTRKDLVSQATQRILALHSYDCPCIVALDIKGGSPEYLNWIAKETL